MVTSSFQMARSATPIRRMLPTTASRMVMALGALPHSGGDQETVGSYVQGKRLHPPSAHPPSCCLRETESWGGCWWSPQGTDSERFREFSNCFKVTQPSSDRNEAPGECLYLYWAVPQRLKPGPAPEQEAGPQPSFHIGGFRDKPGRQEVACITSERPGLGPGISEPLAKSSKEQMLFISKQRQGLKARL